MLPARTGIGGFPPYAPFEHPSQDELMSWVDTMRALGRQHAGTDAGGDALASAAHVLDRRVGQPARAIPVYREAFAAYPRGHPYQGVALLRLVHALLKTGDVEAADDVLRQLDGWSAWAPLRTGRLRGQRDRAMRILLREGPGVRLRVHEGMGRFREAAIVAARIAQAEPTRTAWMVAARLFMRAGRWRTPSGP